MQHGQFVVKESSTNTCTLILRLPMVFNPSSFLRTLTANLRPENRWFLIGMMKLPSGAKGLFSGIVIEMFVSVRDGT